MSSPDHVNREVCEAVHRALEMKFMGAMEAIGRDIAAVGDKVDRLEKRLYYDNGTPSLQTRVNALEAAVATGRRAGGWVVGVIGSVIGGVITGIIVAVAI